MNDKIASKDEKEPSLFQLIRGLTGNELREERASFIIAAVLNLLATLSVLSIPWLIQKVIDEVLPARDTQGLAVYALIIMAGLILYITLWSVHISKIAGSVERVFYRVREKLMMSILSKRHDFYGRFKEGDLITRVSADVEMVATTFFERAVSATLSFLIAIVIAATILIWKWELGLISLASIALYGLLVNKLGEPVSRLSARVREALSGQNTTAIDLINGEKEIRFFHQQKEMVERFGVAADKFRETNTRLLRYTWITLSENISFGWYNVPEEKVHETARLVKLDDVIRAMPKGYETIYGEGGVFLSGGQKQRMALARAIIRDPALLVLDEFTSALDRNTESGILDMVFELFKDQAIICVTHSPLVAERFDRVIRL